MILDQGQVPAATIMVRTQKDLEDNGDWWVAPDALVLDTTVSWYGYGPPFRQYRLGARLNTTDLQPLSWLLLPPQYASLRAETLTEPVVGCAYPGHTANGSIRQVFFVQDTACIASRRAPLAVDRLAVR
jgi:hypothetical protein